MGHTCMEYGRNYKYKYLYFTWTMKLPINSVYKLKIWKYIQPDIYTVTNYNKLNIEKIPVYLTN